MLSDRRRADQPEPEDRPGQRQPQGRRHGHADGADRDEDGGRPTAQAVDCLLYTSSAGTTDIECLYTPIDSVSKKFDVEAKSTKNKLMTLSAGRLRHHRVQIGSKYTIVVTPNYVNAVLEDIKETDTVLIRSGSFSNFLYQSISKRGRDISYKSIDEIVVNNLGADITPVSYTHLDVYKRQPLDIYLL